MEAWILDTLVASTVHEVALGEESLGTLGRKQLLGVSMGGLVVLGLLSRVFPEFSSSSIF